VWRNDGGLQSPERERKLPLMTEPSVRLAFFKLNVPEMEPALAFWQAAFGFVITMSFDEPDFVEHILALPDQGNGPNLLLVEYKDRRDVSIGGGHGPVGLVCDDVEATHERALACGADVLTGVFEAAGTRIALLKSPQGHEIELINYRPAESERYKNSCTKIEIAR
jgi:lactoylglutathione lyase